MKLGSIKSQHNILFKMGRLGIFTATDKGKLPADLTSEVNTLQNKVEEVDKSVQDNTLTDAQRKELADRIFAEKQAEIEKMTQDIEAQGRDLRNLSLSVTQNLEDVKDELRYSKEHIQDPLIALGVLTLQPA
jgi:hypothetical protein